MHKRPVALLWLDAEAAPQVEHVICNVARAARLKYDAPSKILSSTFPLEPNSADFDSLISPLDPHIAEHLVKVLSFHHQDFALEDDGYQDLAAIFYDGKCLIHRDQQSVTV